MSVEGPLTEVPYHPGSPSILGDEHVPVEPVVARERNIAGVQLIQQDSPSAPLPDSTPLFTIISNGTTKGESKLVSSDGYEHSIKKRFNNSVNWRCTHRTRDNICGATLIQRDEEFKLEKNKHIHRGVYDIVQKVQKVEKNPHLQADPVSPQGSHTC